MSVMITFKKSCEW